MVMAYGAYELQVEASSAEKHIAALKNELATERTQRIEAASQLEAAREECAVLRQQLVDEQAQWRQEHDAVVAQLQSAYGMSWPVYRGPTKGHSFEDVIVEPHFYC